MFGGPSYDIAPYLQTDNILIVKIEPAPNVISTGQPGSFFTGMNVGWLYTVTFNNVYGWHYSNIPSLGIWRSVRIEGQPTVKIKDPFVAVLDSTNAANGDVDVAAELVGDTSGWSGTLTGTVEPENFTGNTYMFTYSVSSSAAPKKIHIRFRVPNPQLWWPVDHGNPNLYRLKLSFVRDGGGGADFKQTTFGIRSVKWEILPGGPYTDHYNWTLNINGKQIFIKGSGWCTMDSSMDFSRANYERYIKLAKNQHIQMFRAWGSGMPETDDFYDLCDRYGIMVMQEWPTAWDSHKEIYTAATVYGTTRYGQPYSLLEETVRLNTLRLRNHPSLAIWGAGNESGDPYGAAIDMMGKYYYEMDGTRAFHRAEPWGGSEHNYDLYWGYDQMNNNIKKTADFFGEWGSASVPNYESVMRYLPESEKNVWPAPAGGSFEYHTPVFNQKECMNRLYYCGNPFMNADTMKDLIWGTQMTQATLIKHITDRSRSRWPYCTGALHYKQNDNYPAASWSTIDWYGTPKMSYYLLQDVLTPLHSAAIFNDITTYNADLSVPIYLFDDANELSGAKWEVRVRAYDSNLTQIKSQSFTGSGSITNGVINLGNFTLTAAQTCTYPLITVCEVWKNGMMADRVYYWTNYEPATACIQDLPTTTLSMSISGNNVTVTNTGSLPAIGVNLVCPSVSSTIEISDNYFWLDPGESKTVTVSSTIGIEGVDLWNKGTTQNMTNYALSATATADTEYSTSYVASNAIDRQWLKQDGDAWVSTGISSTHWLKLDFGGTRNISKFVLKHVGVRGDPNYNTRDFKIQGSDDGTNWTDLVTITGNTSSETTHTLTSPASYRYARLYITNSNGGLDNYSRIYEFQAWGDSSQTEKNFATYSTATADTEYSASFVASNAIDGQWANQIGDAWVSTGASSTHWLKLDFGSTKSINRFVVKHVGYNPGENPAYNTRDFKIQGSNDDTNWTDLVTVIDNTQSETTHILDSTQSYRYARLYITNPNGGIDNFARIFEFEAWGGGTTTASNLKAWYKLDEGTGASVADSSDSRYNGTQTGALWVTGKSGNALSFSGSSSSYMQVSGFGANIGSNFTLYAWIKAAQARTGYHVFLAKGPKNTGHYELYINTGDGVFRFYSPDIGDYGSTVAVDDNLWHQVAVTYNGSQMKFYVDGTLRNTVTASGTVTSETEIFRLGTLTDSTFAYGGFVDSVRIYNKPMEQTEIRSLYNSNQ